MYSFQGGISGWGSPRSLFLLSRLSSVLRQNWPGPLGGINLLGVVGLGDICSFRALGYHLVINACYLASWNDKRLPIVPSSSDYLYVNVMVKLADSSFQWLKEASEAHIANEILLCGILLPLRDYAHLI